MRPQARAAKFLSFVLLGGLALPLLGQSDVARITGTVTDASGAVIPGATVTVKNEATGASRKIQTNENGLFVAPQLQPSAYGVSVESAGMATAQFQGIRLQ